jgi:dipeptidyl aminopeptidase/acylaminoacyl peptidase
MPRFLLLFLFLATAAHAARLQPSDRTRLVNVSDPQLSPDGRSVVVLVSRPNVKENRHDSELVLVDVATAAQRPLTSERRGLAQPRWSPDGTRLGFLANAGEKRQLWVMPMSGGDARKVTDAPNGIQQFAWSPDGARFAYITADEPPKKSEEEQHNRSFEIFDDHYLITGEVLPSHLWVIAARGGEAKRLTSGAWSVQAGPVQWTPDGKSIAFTRLATPHSGNFDTARVALLDVGSGAVRMLAESKAQQTQPLLSPDGQSVAYVQAHRGEPGNQDRVWLAPVEDRQSCLSRAATGRIACPPLPRELGTLDRNFYRAFWMPDGKSLLIGAHDGTTTALWLQPTDAASERLDLGEVEPFATYSIDASVGRNGAIAFTGVTPTRPRELYFMESATAKPRRLTSFHDHFETLELARAERITFSSDGYDLDGVLLVPPGLDRTRKHPLVLHLHGGPHNASTTGFSWLPQLLAAQGWVVFQPNYRGSDNLGNRAMRAILMDAGAGPGRDVMAGVEAVKKLGFIDGERLAVGGWSYGGTMTSWLVAHYPVFKAAVAGAAVNSFLDTYNLSDFNVARRSYWGSPYTGDNMKRYLEQSPITYAGKIRTPMLILSNTGDARVPFTQSFAMFRALRDNDVPVRFIAYPVSGHSADDPAHQLDVNRRWIEWLAKYL